MPNRHNTNNIIGGRFFKRDVYLPAMQLTIFIFMSLVPLGLFYRVSVLRNQNLHLTATLEYY